MWWPFGIMLHSYFWYGLFFFFSIKYDVTNDISPITVCGCHSHSLWHPNKAAGNWSWHTDAVIFITFLSGNNCGVRYLFSIGEKRGLKSKILSHWGGGRWFPAPSDQCSCTSPFLCFSPEVILLWPQLLNSSAIVPITLDHMVDAPHGQGKGRYSIASNTSCVLRAEPPRGWDQGQQQPHVRQL